MAACIGITALGSKKNKVFLTVDLPPARRGGIVERRVLCRQRQHFNLDTQQNHLAPDTRGDLAFRGAAGERARVPGRA